MVEDTTAFHELIRMNKMQFHHRVDTRLSRKKWKGDYTGNFACGCLRFCHENFNMSNSCDTVLALCNQVCRKFKDACAISIACWRRGRFLLLYFFNATPMKQKPCFKRHIKSITSTTRTLKVKVVSVMGY